MTRRYLLVAACVVMTVLSGWAWARRGVVTTTDGRKIDGDIDQSRPDRVTVTQKGGTTVVPNDQIASIAWIDSIEDEYQKRAGDIPKDADAAAHIDLARWLFENKAYELARHELDTALRIDPSNADANTLYQTVEGQLRLERARSTPAAEAPAATSGPAPTTTAAVTAVTARPAGPAHTAAEAKYLSAGQINAIKQWEWWQFGQDANVRVRLNGDVAKRYMESDPTLNRAQFNEKPVLEQGIEILQHGTPGMKKDVIVLNDPSALAEYRRTVQPLVAAGCAAEGCHGGPGGGDFFMYPQGENPEAAYTNFYLLMSFARTDHGLQKMIDRTHPEASLLLAYGLPPDLVQTPHPNVPKNSAWRGVFKGRDDPRYRTILDWISHSLNHLETPGHVGPDYGFTFSLDKQAAVPAATTAPSTQSGPTTR